MQDDLELTNHRRNLSSALSPAASGLSSTGGTRYDCAQSPRNNSPSFRERTALRVQIYTMSRRVLGVHCRRLHLNSTSHAQECLHWIFVSLDYAACLAPSWLTPVEAWTKQEQMISRIAETLSEYGRAYCSHASPDWALGGCILTLCLLWCKWHVSLPARET